MKVRYIFIHIYIYSTMFTSLPPRRLRWSAWAAGRSSPNCVPAPYSGNVTSRTRQNRSQSDAPGPKTDLRIDSLRPECPDAMVQGLEGRPLWGRAVYTALHGARLSSVPSGDQSANPASVLGHSGLQRALLSVSSAQKCSRDGRLATPSGVSRAARSAVPCRSSVPGHRASRSKYTGLRTVVSLGDFWGSPDATFQDLWGQAPLGKSGFYRITRCPSLLSALRRSVC